MGLGMVLNPSVPGCTGRTRRMQRQRRRGQRDQAPPSPGSAPPRCRCPSSWTGAPYPPACSTQPLHGSPAAQTPLNLASCCCPLRPAAAAQQAGYSSVIWRRQGGGRRGAAPLPAGPEGQGEGEARQGAVQRQPLEVGSGDGAQVPTASWPRLCGCIRCWRCCFMLHFGSAHVHATTHTMACCAEPVRAGCLHCTVVATARRFCCRQQYDS